MSTPVSQSADDVPLARPGAANDARQTTLIPVDPLGITPVWPASTPKKLPWAVAVAVSSFRPTSKPATTLAAFGSVPPNVTGLEP